MELAKGVYSIRHEDAPDAFPQGNTTVVVGQRDALVVDSCNLPSSARVDIAQIRQWTNTPERYLVNTHWHYDHTMGNGVYWQAFGPRFETPAEIRFIGQFADVVGMTMASECIVAGELGLSYAAVCIVDNLANGVSERPLTWEEFEAGKRANDAAVCAALDRVVPALT